MSRQFREKSFSVKGLIGWFLNCWAHLKILAATRIVGFREDGFATMARSTVMNWW
jgi:hypothetical protein